MFLRILFFLLLAFVFSLCAAMLAATDIFGKIKPETVDRRTFVRIMQLRDFRQCPHDLKLQLLQRAEKEFGIHCEQKPVFEYPLWERQIYRYFQNRRNKNPGNTVKPLLENNLDILAREQFFLWMTEYESAAKTEKKQQMKEHIAELKYWQTVYIDYLHSLNEPVPNMAELWAEFQKTIERFKDGTEPQTAQRIGAFAKVINRHLIAGGVHDAAETIIQKLFKDKEN
ncbi:MAG: hypothetical protein LBT89_08525 [Planctomycetaceae bacterium]|jgi:hypothetical protein|nr:hypothetical protein [Planctomycetaceae bacterium]